jgi:hypothetical protein
MYKSLRVGQELKLPALGAQPSVLPHFTGVDHDQVQSMKVSEDLKLKAKPRTYTQHRF